MPRVVLAGAGSIGRRHLRHLRALGVSSILLLRTRLEPLDEMPDLPVTTDIDTALALDPDLVLVCTPAPRHIHIARAVVRHGCDLFVEKPLSHTWDGVAELDEEVRARGVMASVGFDLRFDPGLEFAKHLVDAGAIGPLVSVQAQVGQYLPDWRPAQDYRTSVTARREAGGGVMLELCHELDYVSWLAGPIAEVACAAGTLGGLEMDAEDTAAMVLRFANGAIGTVHLDCVQRAPSRTCRLVGRNGSIVWDALACEVRWFDASRGVWDGFRYDGHTRDDRLRAQMQHVLACVERRALPKVDIAAAAEVLRVVLAAKEAAATHAVIDISQWQTAQPSSSAPSAPAADRRGFPERTSASSPAAR